MSNKFKFHSENSETHDEVDPWVHVVTSEQNVFKEQVVEVDNSETIIETEQYNEQVIHNEETITQEKNSGHQFSTDAKQKLKTFFGAAKNIGETITDKAKTALEHTEKKILEDSSSLSNRILELENKFEKMKNELIDKNKEIEQLRELAGNKYGQGDSIGSQLIISDMSQIKEISEHLAESTTFVLNLGKYLHKEITIQIKDYLEEEMGQTLAKIKSIKLEELNLEKDMNLKIVNFDFLIEDRTKELDLLISNITKSKIELVNIGETIQNEQEVLNNIVKETDLKENALRELREIIYQSQTKINIDLNKYKEEQLEIIQLEINQEAIEKKEEFNRKINEAWGKIEKVFKESFIEISPEFEEKIKNELIEKNK